MEQLPQPSSLTLEPNPFEQSFASKAHSDTGNGVLAPTLPKPGANAAAPVNAPAGDIDGIKCTGIDNPDLKKELPGGSNIMTPLPLGSAGGAYAANLNLLGVNSPVTWVNPRIGSFTPLGYDPYAQGTAAQPGQPQTGQLGQLPARTGQPATQQPPQQLGQQLPAFQRTQQPGQMHSGLIQPMAMGGFVPQFGQPVRGTMPLESRGILRMPMAPIQYSQPPQPQQQQQPQQPQQPQLPQQSQTQKSNAPLEASSKDYDRRRLMSEAKMSEVKGSYTTNTPASVSALDSKATPEEDDENEDSHNKRRKSYSVSAAASDADDQRRKQFLERNRVAAIRCRQRKKMYVDELKHKVSLFTHAHEALEGRVDRLEADLDEMRQFVLSVHDMSTLPSNIARIANRPLEKSQSQATAPQQPLAPPVSQAQSHPPSAPQPMPYVQPAVTQQSSQ